MPRRFLPELLLIPEPAKSGAQRFLVQEKGLKVASLPVLCGRGGLSSAWNQCLWLPLTVANWTVQLTRRCVNFKQRCRNGPQLSTPLGAPRFLLISDRCASGCERSSARSTDGAWHCYRDRQKHQGLHRQSILPIQTHSTPEKKPSLIPFPHKSQLFMPASLVRQRTIGFMHTTYRLPYLCVVKDL